jgi:hypothetical protein
MKEELKEAKRYLINAKEILRDKAVRKDRFYADKKYVRMAGNTAYNGVLEALDAIVPPPAKGKRKSIEHYQHYLAKKDKKILTLLNDAYNTLHLAMGYDGNLNVLVAKAGMDTAEELLNYIVNKAA